MPRIRYIYMEVNSKALVAPFILTTMLAKSLGTLAMVYAIDELQNPLPPVNQCCVKEI